MNKQERKQALIAIKLDSIALKINEINEIFQTDSTISVKLFKEHQQEILKKFFKEEAAE
jgi:hypothetical protein